MAGVERRFIFGAPAGSTPTILTSRPRQLDRRGDAGDQSAAADRHEHRRDVRALLEDLEPGGALAGDDPRVIERRHHREAACAASASARARRSSDVVPAKITSAPNARAPSTLTSGAVVGITTTAGAPSVRPRAPWPGRGCRTNR